MSDKYEFGVTCKNMDCRQGDKRTMISLSLGPKPQAQEMAATALRSITWDKGEYYKCDRCGRMYLYLASEVFAFIPQTPDISGMEGGKRRSLTHDEY